MAERTTQNTTETRSPQNIAKEAWVDGHIDANHLFPQEILVIRYGFTASVILNPPDRWIDFLCSELSENHVDKMATAMNYDHEEMGIMKFTPDSPQFIKLKQEHPEIGSSASISKKRHMLLYEREKALAFNMLFQTAFGEPPPSPLRAVEPLNTKGPIILPSEERVREFQAWWDNPQNEQTVRHLIENAVLIRDVMQGTTAKAISELYISTLIKPRQEFATANFYRDEKARELVRQLYENLPEGYQRSHESIVLQRFLEEIEHGPRKLDSDPIRELVKALIKDATRHEQTRLVLGIEP